MTIILTLFIKIKLKSRIWFLVFNGRRDIGVSMRFEFRRYRVLLIPITTSQLPERRHWLIPGLHFCIFSNLLVLMTVDFTTNNNSPKENCRQANLSRNWYSITVRNYHRLCRIADSTSLSGISIRAYTHTDCANRTNSVRVVICCKIQFKKRDN